MYTKVKDYCKTCPGCQLTAGKHIALVPLMPGPFISFERIGVEIVNPVKSSQSGNRFINL